MTVARRQGLTPRAGAAAAGAKTLVLNQPEHRTVGLRKHFDGKGIVGADQMEI